MNTGGRTISGTRSWRIPSPIQDFHATLLHVPGLDHAKRTYPVPGGLQQRLTTVTKPAKVVPGILS